MFEALVFVLSKKINSISGTIAGFMAQNINIEGINLGIFTTCSEHQSGHCAHLSTTHLVVSTVAIVRAPQSNPRIVSVAPQSWLRCLEFGELRAL